MGKKDTLSINSLTDDIYITRNDCIWGNKNKGLLTISHEAEKELVENVRDIANKYNIDLNIDLDYDHSEQGKRTINGEMILKIDAVIE